MSGARAARIDRALRCGAWLTLAFAWLALPACGGPVGVALPNDVGSSHVRERSERRAAADEADAEPVAIGTDVWANFRGTGYYFHGVVVERREAEHRVVYADGASEWLPASALRPDSLAADAEIDIRRSFIDDFAASVVGRRLGAAYYVRTGAGDEIWTVSPHVRFLGDSAGTPRRGDAPDESASASTAEPGSTVLVNYRGEGLRFAAVVTARGEDGRLHVVYLDGEREWVDPGALGPDDVAEGAEVHVRRRWDPPEWVRGSVARRVGHALLVELDDGGMAWTSLFRIRVPFGSGPIEPRGPVEQPAATAPGADSDAAGETP